MIERENKGKHWENRPSDGIYGGKVLCKIKWRPGWKMLQADKVV